MDIVKVASNLFLKNIYKMAPNMMIERINYKFTVSLLAIFSAIVSFKQYYGEPISCWYSNN